MYAIDEGKPLCAVCGGPVRSLYVDLDVEEAQLVFTALCCQGLEVVLVPLEALAGAIPGTLEFGCAFDGSSVDYTPGHFWPNDFGEDDVYEES